MSTPSQNISFTLLNGENAPVVYLENTVTLTLTAKNSGSTTIPITTSTSLVLVFKKPLIHGEVFVGERMPTVVMLTRSEEERIEMEGWYASYKFTSTNPENVENYDEGNFNSIFFEGKNELRFTFASSESGDWKPGESLSFTFGPAQGLWETPVQGEVSLLLYQGKDVITQQSQKLEAAYYTG